MTTNWYSSIKPCCVSNEVMEPLPKIRKSPPGSRFIFSISSGSNVGMRRVLLHDTAVRVREKTSFRAALSQMAMSRISEYRRRGSPPAPSSAFGQNTSNRS